MNTIKSAQPNEVKGFLAWIEQTGNKLPDPVFIFLYCIIAVVVVSVLAALLGVSAPHPTQLDAAGNAVIVNAQSLLSAANIQRLLVEMPATFTSFPPLGIVLVVMLGAGVAERSGLFGSALSRAVSVVPAYLLTPAIALIGILGNLAGDAAFVILLPLAGVIFAAAGRHPIAGIAAAFAGVGGAVSANLVPNQLDALLFGITEAAAETIMPTWGANIAGNYFFIVGMTVVFLPVIWYVTDKIIEPRLGPYSGKLPSVADGDLQNTDSDIAKNEMTGLRHAGYATLAIILLWVFLCIGPGTPLINESAAPQARLTPFFQSLVAGFFLLFLATGWAYGRATGSIKDHRDLVKMMSGSMGDFSHYLVLAFTAAHFVAMFNWSNLGLIFAINGAAVLDGANLPHAVLLPVIIVFTSIINLFMASASAKWALLAPVLVPMMMLLGVSPEMTTAAFRVGDGSTNIITPLNFFLPLILVFCQRWEKDFGLGSLVATMLPYSMLILLSGTIMTIFWIFLGLPLGPGATVEFSLQ